MTFSRLFGYAFPEFGWVPAPTYTLRRAMIMDVLNSCRPGRVLEMGPGSGAFLRELADRGFFGIGVEQSPEARTLTAKVLAEVNSFTVCGDSFEVPGHGFDYLFAFEVLEHIEDDRAALQTWASYLNDGGIAMVSVPAHQAMWDHSDVWAGHYRRYGKDELKDKIESAGLKVVSIASYGWPLANLIKPIRSFIYGRQIKRAAGSNSDQDVVKRSNRSGIERKNERTLYAVYSSLPFKLMFSLFMKLQRLTVNCDWGVGYLVVAKKHA